MDNGRHRDKDLEAMTFAPSSDRSDLNDLYLKSRDMWGRHGTAVLRNERSVLLDRLGY